MSKTRLYIRIWTVILIYLLLVIYIGWNISTWLLVAFNFYAPLFFWSLLLVIAFAYPVTRYKEMTPFKIIGAYWVGFMQYAVFLFPLANIFVFLSNLAGLPHKPVITFTGALMFLLFLVIFCYGTWQAYATVVRPFHITIKKKTNKKQLRIAVASDMHFGTLSGVRHVKRLVRHINHIQPDLILLVGDVIDDAPDVFIRKGMGSILANMNAPLGIYGVLGNHEYYGGAIPEYVKEMERIGITILQDEIISLDETITLIGRKDKTAKNRSTIERLLKEVQPDSVIIMMDHQPFQLKEACIHGVDLLLCGHTHRGQMAPNHLITKRMYELDWGYKQKEQLHTFVSSGFGFWGPPLRLGSRSEIIQIDVTFEHDRKS